MGEEKGRRGRYGEWNRKRRQKIRKRGEIKQGMRVGMIINGAKGNVHLNMQLWAWMGISKIGRKLTVNP